MLSLGNPGDVTILGSHGESGARRAREHELEQRAEQLIWKVAKLEKKKVEEFSERLTAVLQEKFREHWYPDNPVKGQAYRCIRVNRLQREDPELRRACEESRVLYCDLGLPWELTLWVDPGEVCCRYGEKNHAFTVASFPSSSDADDKEDISKKVTSAVEKVTSDYHSGSSSDEETPRDTQHTHPCPPFRPVFQVPEFMYQPVPAWQQLPRKKCVLYRGQGFPQPQYRYHPQPRQGRAFHQGQWAPPGPRRGQGYWGMAQVLGHC